MSGEKKTQDLRQKRKEARQSGGPERIAARQRVGVKSARERVESLLDADTFVEVDVFIRGVVAGHGKISGRDVYVFSQDGEASDGVWGDAFVRKIVKMADLALTNGAPLVGIYDSGTASTALPLGGLSGLSMRVAAASGAVPQIAAVVGPMADAAALSPALADLVIMVKGSSQLLLGDKAANKEAGLEKVAGARALSELGGVAHLATDDEAGCLEAVRTLLSYLPQNNLEDAPLEDDVDPVDRMDAELDSISESDKPQDAREVLGRILDQGSFVELQPQWGTRTVIGFARLGGRSIGVVASQPSESDGRLDGDSAAKAARFVRLCDAFNVPLITFVDTPGFVTGEAQGYGRALRQAAKLVYAYAEATVPKLTVVTGRALAEGFEVMCPKHLGADMCIAWPNAVISVSGSPGTESDGAGSPYVAAEAGHLDDVIDPATTRPRLVVALEACISKRAERPAKKHGNIPL